MKERFRSADAGALGQRIYTPYLGPHAVDCAGEPTAYVARDADIQARLQTISTVASSDRPDQRPSHIDRRTSRIEPRTSNGP